MACHTLHSPYETIESLDIADCAEQASHDVESVFEVEVCHIRLVKNHTGVPLASDSEHLLVNVESLDLEMPLQVGEVQAGTGCSATCGFYPVQ